ncbi:MAG: aromatic ring-hydroxylating dioxygenase subunit alpha [Gammaproteobacteria bacterium]|nr:aromatic ring-hydroxylating dioxygenase subunit alpha [Gammaproteobacteria bacterium]
MFINFWYAAALAAEVKQAPMRRRMLGQDFVLFRDSQGKAHCLSNTCTHRGGSLSGGKVIGDEVQCPYHGWRFGGDGRCSRIPSLGRDASVPARSRVDAYPTIERYGLVFAFLGDLPEAERPPIMDIAEFGADGPLPGWAATTQFFEWDIDFQRSVENGIDPAHNEFVHPTHGFSYANEETYQIKPLKIIDSEWATGFFSEIWVPALPEEQMRKASGRSDAGYIRSGTGHHGISSVWTFINPSPTMHIYQYLFETPIDDDRTSLYLVNMRNFLIEPEHDQRMTTRNEYVAFQDRDVLSELHPVVTPRSQNHELFMPSDQCVGLYRQKVAQWEARGWRIDTGAVRANRNKIAYAIPSPARREQKGWVLDSVPLVATSATAAAAKAERVA